jgi:hypothetical protein
LDIGLFLGNRIVLGHVVVLGVFVFWVVGVDLAWVVYWREEVGMS